ADLVAKAADHRRHLGVEDGGGQAAGQVVEDLQVLPCRVEDLQYAAVIEKLEQRGKINSRRERIDDGGLFRACDLDQAELRPVGGVADELGVDRDEIGLALSSAKAGEGVGVCQDQHDRHL